MKRVSLWRVASVLVVTAMLGVIAAWAGLAPISARAGHWAATKWFVELTKRRAVKARSLGIEVPPLTDSAMVVRGAGHYETGCRPCHGAPGRIPPVTLRHMTPRPPSLASRVGRWEPEELFWIVRDGLKFTGMPGWPAPEREDEVWAMVAFLRSLPEMSFDDYQELAFGAPRAGAREVDAPRADAPPGDVLTSCGRCHGYDGLGGPHGAFPKLAGQHEAYLVSSLEAYAQATRKSGMMEPIAAALSDERIRELARYYSRRVGLGSRPNDASSPEARSSGAAIARNGIPSLGVPSCAECHGPTEGTRRDVYPRLGGQDASYLVRQLELFRSGARGGSSYAHLMDPVAARISPEAIRDVAAYYASLGE